MGMSASQARLLSITARLNDVEYKSQNIANIKIRLADESERLAMNYSKALGQQKYTYTTYATGSAQKIDLTLKNLYQPGSRYQLRTPDGKIALSKQYYDAFAYTCRIGQDKDSWRNGKYAAGAVSTWKEDFVNCFIFKVNGCSDAQDFTEKYGLSWSQWCKDNPGMDSQDILYNYVLTQGTNVDFTKEDVDYWMSLCEQLKKEAGQGSVVKNGVTVPTYDTSNIVNLSGAEVNDSAWLYNALESGEFMLVDVLTGENVTASNTIALAIETDTSKYAIAEAEYNAANMKINNKEKQLDNEMKKLDTEHNALQTEMDSIKNLIGKNIEKSFNLFS